MPNRDIGDFVRILLFVRAAGRCEFDGCNENLAQHPVTLQAGNFAQMAHVVAFSRDGPRGSDGERPLNINSVENLMLLCPRCHKLIDDHPADFPRARLEDFKRAHEERIARVTELGPDRKTSVLVIKAPIGGQAVAIQDGHIFSAVLPRYPISRAGTVIDLSDLAGEREGEAFYELGRNKIDRDLERLFAEGGEAATTPHLSVLGLAPIPLLVHLGARLSNKVSTDFYHRHRDTEDWAWKDDGEAVRFTVGLRREGAADGPVALLLPLSGSIPIESLPEPIQSSAWIYELGLEGRVPDPTFLRRRDELDGFRLALQQVLGLIGQKHGPIPSIELVPAVPARHVNNDGVTCVLVPEEWFVGERDQSFAAFMAGPVRNYFLGQALVESGQPWPFGERSHGSAGMVEAYGEILRTDDVKEMRAKLDYLRHVQIKGHWPCHCGSGEIIRRCHLGELRALQSQVSPKLARTMLARLRAGS